MTIKKITYSSSVPGLRLVVLGAVHGNEQSGTKAITSVLKLFDEDQITLNQGSVTFIPICNPKAFNENKRFIDRNLNRQLYFKEQPKDYEDFLGNILCKVLDDADVLLDLHTYHSFGDAFCFLGTSTQKELDYCRALGVNKFVYGWQEAFAQDQVSDPSHSIGTTEYVRAKGGIATTIECGHHFNSNNATIGRNAILNALNFCNISNYKCDDRVPSEEYSCIKMDRVFHKKKKGVLSKSWRHMDKVKKGEVLAIYEDGDQVFAPTDGAIILPKEQSTLESEWFYFGIESPFPKPSKI